MSDKDPASGQGPFSASQGGRDLGNDGVVVWEGGDTLGIGADILRGGPGAPSASPTASDRRFGAGSLRHIHCDFAELAVGPFLSDSEQSDQLASLCGVSVAGTSRDGTGTRDIRVVDTANTGTNEVELGSPHSKAGRCFRIDTVAAMSEPEPDADSFPFQALVSYIF